MEDGFCKFWTGIENCSIFNRLESPQERKATRKREHLYVVFQGRKMEKGENHELEDE